MDRSSKKGARLFALNLYYRLPVVIVCIAIFWQSALPSLLEEQLFPYSDKVFHAVTYAVLAFLIARNLKKEKPLWRLRQLWIASVVLAGLYGVSDEFHQFFVPSRVCSLWDMVANIIGSLMGSIIYLDISFRRK